jgi:hypothetical protein
MMEFPFDGDDKDEPVSGFDWLDDASAVGADVTALGSLEAATGFDVDSGVLSAGDVAPRPEQAADDWFQPAAPIAECSVVPPAATDAGSAHTVLFPDLTGEMTPLEAYDLNGDGSADVAALDLDQDGVPDVWAYSLAGTQQVDTLLVDTDSVSYWSPLTGWTVPEPLAEGMEPFLPGADVIAPVGEESTNLTPAVAVDEGYPETIPDGDPDLLPEDPSASLDWPESDLLCPCAASESAAAGPHADPFAPLVGGTTATGGGVGHSAGSAQLDGLHLNPEGQGATLVIGGPGPEMAAVPTPSPTVSSADAGIQGTAADGGMLVNVGGPPLDDVASLLTGMVNVGMNTSLATGFNSWAWRDTANPEVQEWSYR